jgi:hypothetical protein
VANNGLNYHPREGGCQPEPGKVLHIGPKGLQDTARIGILKGKSELYPQESETHIPNLPEAKLWSFAHGLVFRFGLKKGVLG